MDLEINKRVTHYRKEANLTQAEVAGLIGMKSSTYSQMEREGDISAERIVKLAKVFKINVGLLLYGKEIETPEPSPVDKGEAVVVLPKLPFGMDYVPLKNKYISIITIIQHLTRKQQKYICDLLDYLRKTKKAVLPHFPND